MARSKISSGIELEFESFGRASDPPILLIAGFGAQMLAWAEGFCRQLAARGRFVIRFDNRDCGSSTVFADHPVDIGAVMAASSGGDLAAIRSLVPYTLRDMARDAVGLIEALGLGRAHVVGSSMGGMIAQLVAIQTPECVLSLTSMMSSTGETDYGRSTPEAAAALLAPVASEKEAFVAAAVTAARVWGSRRYFDADAVASLAAASFDRGIQPAGTARQLGALLATGGVADELRRLRIPTLVLHGLDDTLITPSGGERTAELIAGSKLLLVPDMGHDRPEPLWPMLIDAIADHTASVSA